MASRTVMGENGGNEGSREKQRRGGESKFYSRKSFKGLKSSNNGKEAQGQNIFPEDGNSSQQQLVHGRFDAVSENSSSLAGNGMVKVGFLRQENRVRISLLSRSKKEIQELRRKLENELDLVRKLVRRMEGKEGQINGVCIDNGGDGGVKQVNSEVRSVGRSRDSRPLHQLSVSVLENGQGVSDHVEKEKRTPKSNQLYRNSEFLLAKDKFPPAEGNKKKSNGKKGSVGESGHGFGLGKFSNQAFKSCSNLLERLMKHKHGWVFNQPVDTMSLGLHDYFDIIKHPMDLGTVKSQLDKNWYKSPRGFAEDVRLTFRNAMTYNPKGQDVHVMAEQLLKLFEEKWAAVEADYMRDLRLAVDYDVSLPTPTSRKVPQSQPPPLEMKRILERSESNSHPFYSQGKPVNNAYSGRTPTPKKPKAKDPNKREMTYEEKQKLSSNLQNLPSEKLDNVVQIIKKKNPALCQQDDEIEVDIDSVDTETLWELDRFVTNYKKSLSKKRKAELENMVRAEAEQDVPEKNTELVVVEARKDTETGEKNVSSPVEVEEQVENASRSSSPSSSSSDSGSASSDSDSENSSGSGSDAEHSPRT